METIPAKTIVNRTKDPSWFGSEYNMNIYCGCYHIEDFDRYIVWKANAFRRG